MSRKPILAANWKLHKTHADALQFAQKLHYTLERDDCERADVVICGPFTTLRTLQTVIQSDRMPFHLGAQNVAPRTCTGRTRARTPGRSRRRCSPPSTSST